MGVVELTLAIIGGIFCLLLLMAFIGSILVKKEEKEKIANNSYTISDVGLGSNENAVTNTDIPSVLDFNSIQEKENNSSEIVDEVSNNVVDVENSSDSTINLEVPEVNTETTVKDEKSDNEIKFDNANTNIFNEVDKSQEDLYKTSLLNINELLKPGIQPHLVEDENNLESNSNQEENKVSENNDSFSMPNFIENEEVNQNVENDNVVQNDIVNNQDNSEDNIDFNIDTNNDNNQNENPDRFINPVDRIIDNSIPIMNQNYDIPKYEEPMFDESMQLPRIDDTADETENNMEVSEKENYDIPNPIEEQVNSEIVEPSEVPLNTEITEDSEPEKIIVDTPLEEPTNEIKTEEKINNLVPDTTSNLENTNSINLPDLDIEI